MSQKNMSFEDMIKLIKLISEKKLDKKSEREISKAVSKFGRYEANEIMQVTYMIKGGANLRFSNKQNAIQVLGGREKAERSKSNLEEFILKNEFFMKKCGFLPFPSGFTVNKLLIFFYFFPHFYKHENTSKSSGTMILINIITSQLNELWLDQKRGFYGF